MSLRPKEEVLIYNHFKIPHPDTSGFGMTFFIIKTQSLTLFRITPRMLNGGREVIPFCIFLQAEF
jgi:hypothetical protein